MTAIYQWNYNTNKIRTTKYDCSDLLRAVLLNFYKFCYSRESTCEVLYIYNSTEAAQILRTQVYAVLFIFIKSTITANLLSLRKTKL
jgi:hypothetical protein